VYERVCQLAAERQLLYDVANGGNEQVPTTTTTTKDSSRESRPDFPLFVRASDQGPRGTILRAGLLTARRWFREIDA
jgi:hypothetical protein